MKWCFRCITRKTSKTRWLSCKYSLITVPFIAIHSNMICNMDILCHPYVRIYSIYIFILYVTCVLCLIRSWFQRQQTCPTCRESVLRRTAPTSAAAARQPRAANNQGVADRPPFPPPGTSCCVVRFKKCMYYNLCVRLSSSPYDVAWNVPSTSCSPSSPRGSSPTSKRSSTTTGSSPSSYTSPSPSTRS